jgi:hypothetical protein
LGVAAAGGTEKSALSCDSVSRIKLVMSWDWSSALVNILGGGNLGHGQDGRSTEAWDVRQLGNGPRTERDLFQVRVEERHD